MATGSINISSNISRNTLLATYTPKQCYNLSAVPKDKIVRLQWNDPDDYTTTDGKYVGWSYTVVIRKTGSYPINESDGTVVTKSSIKNQYSKTPFIDQGLTNGITYYYSVFACSTDGTYSHEPCRTTAVPVPYKKMTIVINTSNSNGLATGTYADDAIGMPNGKDASAWTTFFGYRPCLFKDGTVVGYLNPNDYSKFEDGSDADITSGASGNVMVEFPRRGLKISTSGNTLSISMTEDPDDPEFTYYAHNRGNKKKDAFYVGAYMSGSNSILNSLSGTDWWSTTIDFTLTNVKNISDATGDGYNILSFYQLVYIQSMFLLQYQGVRDSQRIHGEAYYQNSYKSGGLNSAGLMYGDKNFVKLFGLESFYGYQIVYAVPGVYVDSDYYIRTTTDPDADISTYMNTGQLIPKVEKYSVNVFGTSELGFISKSGNGSSSTYFADYVGSGVNKVGATFGGQYVSGSVSSYHYDYGLFQLFFQNGIKELQPTTWFTHYVQTRMMYL